MTYACDKDGNLVDPKVIFHGEVNTASVSGEEASKPKQSKEIATYKFTPKYTNTQIYFETTKEKDMFTAERSHVTYSVVDEIVHTEGDENLCAQFNSGFTEIVKSFERDKTDNEQINDAIRTYCSSDLLPETFSIGHAYIVKREDTYYKYFSPDTITTLAEQKVQYEKHKEYINSPECNPKPKETSYFIAVPYAVTSNHDVSCYTIPLNSAVLEYYIKTSSIYVNSKYAEYETAYNKRRNYNIRWKLDKPTSDFEIILDDLNLRDAIINNFQRWLTNTKQDSIPKINSTSRVLNEAAFRISRYFNRIKYSPCGDFKNILHETDNPIVSSGDTSLDYGVVPKFEMSVKDIQNGDEVTEENYFIKVEYALKENNPFGATSAKEMFTLGAITTMQIDAIHLSNYIEYTKTHNEKIVKIKDGSIQSRLDNTPHQLYVHIDTQEMYVQNGEFSFLPAAPFFAEKEEKIMDKQDEDEIDQYNIECEQGEHEIHNAMDNNLSPERWDARDYHINHAQVAANVATADTLEESRHINLSKQFKDYFQRFTSDQVKQTTINNIMKGM